MLYPCDTVSLSVTEACHKKRTSQILTGPNKFVILGDQT